MIATKRSRFIQIKLFLIAAAVLYVFVSALDPLSAQGDTDYLWHIKQGEYIVQHMRIPHEDPFTYTPKDDEPREQGILAWYWLADVILYAAYKTFGFHGLSVISAVFPALAVLGLLLAAYRTHFLLAFILGVLATETFLGNANIKPNAFSVALAPFALLIFLHFRENLASWKRSWPLWAVMLLWANLHPGYVLFILALWAIAAGDTLTHFFAPTDESLAKAKNTLLLTLLASAATLINPVFGLAYHQVLVPLLFNTSTGTHSQLIVSERSFIDFLQSLLSQGPSLKVFLIFPVIAMVLVPFALGISRKRMPIGETLGVLFVTAAFLFSVRTLPFFVVVGGALVYSQQIFRFPLSQRFILITRTTALAGIISLAWHNLESARPGGLRDSFQYPKTLGEFLEKHRFTGNMLNDFTLGNYLLFAHYPQYKPFIDARQLNWSVFAESEAFLQGLSDKPENPVQGLTVDSLTAVNAIRDLILHGDQHLPTQQPYWREILNKYNIDVVVSGPAVSGNINWGLFKLLYDGDWRMVYVGDYYVVFIRNTTIYSGQNTSLPALDIDLLYRQGLAQLQRPGFFASIYRKNLSDLRRLSLEHSD